MFILYAQLNASNFETNRPTAFVINLETRKWKWEFTVMNFPELNLHRVLAINGAACSLPPKLALLITNLNLLQAIIHIKLHLRLPFIIVMEDDIVKTTFWPVAWPGVVAFLEQNPTIWELAVLDPFLCFDDAKVMKFRNSTLLFEVTSFRAYGFILYSRHFFNHHAPQLILSYWHKLHKCSQISCVAPLDLMVSYHKGLTKVTPRNLLLRQDVNKFSTTENINTKFYESFYRLTEYVLNYSGDLSRIHNESDTLSFEGFDAIPELVKRQLSKTLILRYTEIMTRLPFVALANVTPVVVGPFQNHSITMV